MGFMTDLLGRWREDLAYARFDSSASPEHAHAVRSEPWPEPAMLAFRVIFGLSIEPENFEFRIPALQKRIQQ